MITDCYKPRRCDVWMVDMEEANGSHIQRGVRPVIVVQNDVGNFHSPNTIVVTLTSTEKKPQPTRFVIPAGVAGLSQDSTVAAENIFTIGSENLKSFLGTLVNTKYEGMLDEALRASLNIN